MNDQPRIPDSHTRARTVTRMREICQMFDAQIILLDELIANIEAENRNNPVNTYRRQRGKQLLTAWLQEDPQQLQDSQQ